VSKDHTHQEGDLDRDRALAREYEIDELERFVQDDPGSAHFPALAEAHRRAGHPERAREISEQGLRRAPRRMAGQVSLGLALLDLDEISGARDEFAAILDDMLEPYRVAPTASLDPAPESMEGFGPSVEADFGRDLDDDEIDHAFVAAESQVEEMHSANRVAEEALLHHAPAEEGGAVGGLVEAEEEGGVEEARFDPVTRATFHTKTMASLLEQQGHHAGAEVIRQALTLGSSERQSSAEEAETAAAGMDAAESPEAGASELPSGEKVRVLATLQSWLRNLQGGSA